MKPIIRASSLAFREKCPAAKLLIARAAELGIAKEFDESNLSEATREGIWAHYEAAARFLENGATGENAWPEQLPVGYQPSETAKWIARYYTETVLAQTPGHHAMEVELGISMDFPRFTLSGHVDMFTAEVVEDKVMSGVIWDLKSGRLPVEVKDNLQLLAYAVMLLNAYPDMQSLETKIVQPRNDDAYHDRVSGVYWSSSDLKILKQKLEERINYILDNPTTVETGQHCCFCHAKMICPTFHKDMKEQLNESIIQSLKEPSKEKLAELAILRKKYSKPLDEAAELLKEKIEAEGSFEHDGCQFIVTERGGKRSITNKEECDKRLEDMPYELYLEAVDFPVANIESALAKHLDIPLESKAKNSTTDGKREFKKRFGDITEQGVNKILLIK